MRPGKLSPAHASRIALGAFVLILMGLGAYSVASAMEGRAALRQGQDDVRIDQSYQQAALGLARAEVAVGRFLAAPNDDDRVAFEAAVVTTQSALDRVAQSGNPEDRALVAAMREQYDPVLTQTYRLFDAVQSGSAFTETLPQKDTGLGLGTTLESFAEARKHRSLSALESQYNGQAFDLWVKLGVYGVAFVAAFVLLLALRSSSRKEAEGRMELERLRHAAHSDALTGLGNHRSFQEDLHRELARGESDGRHVSLALIDVDEFKEVNDTWGHSRGDQVLASFATILRREVRAGDGVFRIGGDEFAVILPSVRETAGAVTLERVRAAAASELECTVSIGVAECASSVGMDIGVLRGRADAALYEAKRTGRNAVVSYAGCAAVTPMLFSDQQVHDLRAILLDGRMRAAFQPIWNIETGQLLAYEALARPLPESGMPGPQLAFDIAERIGKSHELDAICRRAILARAHEIPPGVKLFLNLSPYSLNRHGFSAQELVDEVRAAGIEPSQVVIEITELSTVPAGVIGAACVELRAAGFSFALDDVGAGNAGLEMLRKVPVDYVKIDRAVIVSAMSDSVARAVLSAIVAFASASGARVVAEGIEDEAMLKLVERVGDWHDARAPRVHAVQGFYLGRPTEEICPTIAYPARPEAA